MPPDRIAADSGPLIVFARSGLIDIARKITGKILIPATVFAECTQDPAKPGAQTLAGARQNALVDVIPDADPTVLPELRGIANLGAGEIAAIALAAANTCPVLMDERLGRTIAALHNIPVVGSAGLLLAAKQRGLVDKIAPILAAWRGWGYFLSPRYSPASSNGPASNRTA